MARAVGCPVWIDRRIAATLACALIAACSPDPQRRDRRVDVVRTRAAAPRVAPVAPPTPAATPDPPRASTPPRRAFVDPPLPAELVDPPGLAPLPPRPVFGNDHQGGMP